MGKRHRLICATLGAGILFALRATAADLSGDYTATAVSLMLDRSVVSSWLPPSTQLASQESLVPVYFLLGDQRNVSLVVPLTFGHHYREMIAVVPNVLYRGKSYLFFPRLYLDNAQAVFWGIQVYGFPKVLSDMNSTESAYSIQDASTKANLLEASLQIDTTQALSPNMPILKSVLDTFALPMLLEKNGNLNCSAFEMDLKTAQFHPAAVSMQTFDGLMPNLPALELQQEPMSENSPGSFQLSASWRVPAPHACR